jgi:quinol monooxygenase YgiN
MSVPITVLVEYQIRAETTTMDQWLVEWQIRAEDARIGEPHTIAYGAARNTDDPLNLLVFERYAGGEASLQAHVDRPAHAALLANMGAANMTKRRVMSARATDLDYGWWSPADASTDQHDLYLTVLNMRFADPGQKSAFLEKAAEHIDWCRANEPDSLIMGVGEATADADREIDLKTGDLLLINGYRDQAACRLHHDGAEHVAFSERVKAAGLAPDNLFFRTYQSTGNGFLWRN